MNDAKSMLMMYSYAAMKAAEDKAEEKAKDTTKSEAKAETKTKAVNVDKQTKEVKAKQRGKKNDK